VAVAAKRQRRAYVSRGIEQRRIEIVDLMTLGAIADAELNTEVDAKTDEQNGEGHRNQVERTHQGQSDRAVMERPTIKLTKTARMIRHDRRASHRMVSTTTMVAVVLTKLPHSGSRIPRRQWPPVRFSRSFAPYCEGNQVSGRLANGVGRGLAGISAE